MRFHKDSLIAVLLLVGGVAATMAFVYIPQNKKLSDLREQIVTEKREIQKRADRAAVVPRLIRETNAMKAQSKGFDRRMPQSDELGEFLREIGGLLANENFSDQSIEPGRPSREMLFNTLPIIMKFKGSYLSLGAFLDKINTMERLTRVQRLTINAPALDGRSRSGGRGATAGSDELDIELQLNIYNKAS